MTLALMSMGSPQVPSPGTSSTTPPLSHKMPEVPSHLQGSKVSEGKGVQLGLGDFIFHIALVGKASPIASGECTIASLDTEILPRTFWSVLLKGTRGICMHENSSVGHELSRGLCLTLRVYTIFKKACSATEEGEALPKFHRNFTELRWKAPACPQEPSFYKLIVILIACIYVAQCDNLICAFSV